METYCSNTIRRRVLSLRLKAQYIWHLGAGVLGLLVLFAVLYILGVNAFACLGVILVAGLGLFFYVYRLSHTYGEHGLMKARARRKVPVTIKIYSRKTFTRLCKK